MIIDGIEYVTKSSRDELRHKLDREIFSHRMNCAALNEESGRRLAAEKSAKDMANAFMLLHNLAKTYADPPAVASPYPPGLFTTSGRISRMEFAEDSEAE